MRNENRPSRDAIAGTGTSECRTQDHSPLWPHLQLAIAATEETIAIGRPSGLWSVPTGSGKARAFSHLAHGLGWRTFSFIATNFTSAGCPTRTPPRQPVTWGSTLSIRYSIFDGHSEDFTGS